MANHNNPFQWLKEKLESLKQMPPRKNGGKTSYLLILLALGALFMIMGSMWNNDGDEHPAAVLDKTAPEESSEAFGSNQSESNDGMKLFEDQYEQQLKEALESIVGVRSVTVIVNVSATEKKVFEKDTILRNQTTQEGDTNGGTRQVEDQSKEEQIVIIQNGDKETPLTSETKKPDIQGVLVVAEGAENMQVKKWIREAVTKSLNVPVHKVAVIPKKSKGES
ncbi:stage III sporulation protein AG [Lederbergia galactosidilytica]|uniref:Stage III sporulation protein AG n=1 Tax=Lederbergia galactosidilytica TaxID=217031 RepID=A0A0Q9Y3W3_9BACI|nr:stage III sporulation protein AG [Lederbergia galactosidilytica]KRG11604.1 stage III sporulation protein AG [Lederbergia galactosidilytica]KRG15647.1 stage III sporulation protein AG [Virgibacillus soli]MBP1914743.1 stage III sporulation protein AG [Lederbergia galactosidilytica]OAK75320.1 stage III sporulation protein AG [Lederbergia galactosidilytica]